MLCVEGQEQASLRAIPLVPPTLCICVWMWARAYVCASEERERVNLADVHGYGPFTLLIFMLMGMYAIIGVQLFGTTFPKYFASLTDAGFTLFQVMTLESWRTFPRYNLWISRCVNHPCLL